MIATSSGLFELAAGLRQRADAVEELARQFHVFERNAAIVSALCLYPGKPSRCAKALASDLKSYAGNQWLRDRRHESLPALASDKHRAWFRILRSRSGEPIGWRQILNIADFCNGQPLKLQNALCDSEHDRSEMHGDF
ncbi:hypothetical protein [Methylocystis rosea]|uniref:Uncharacterized protein n=1 Tax=Methylocystis rosea TaxID=173366 RepID=A0A3G8M1Z6_9HYPH|nr:hypothetical protein [Methylocystis rosea]AZG75989.1 hypothetical protein EHO51_04155 [Methylocystis rosea]